MFPFLSPHRTARNDDGKDGEKHDLLCRAVAGRAHVVRRESAVDTKS